MKIKALFDNCDEIDIESYLEKCGIENVDEYLTGQVVEPYINYDNIKECAEEIIKFIMKEGGSNVN